MQLKRHCIEANVKPDKARKISNLLCLGQTSWTKIILNALLIQAKPGKADDTFMHSAAACSRPTFAQNLQLKLFLLFHTNQTAFRNLTNAQKCMVKDLFILRLHYLKINIKILTFYWIFFGKHMILLHITFSNLIQFLSKYKDLCKKAFEANVNQTDLGNLLPLEVFQVCKAPRSVLQPLLEKQQDMVTRQRKLRQILAPGRVHVCTVGCSFIHLKRKEKDLSCFTWNFMAFTETTKDIKKGWLL